MKLNKRITKIEATQKKAEEDVIKVLENLPDNPRIKRNTAQPNTFTIKMSDLGNGMVLSAKYHDFKTQYGILIDIVKERGLQSFMITVGRLRKINKMTYKGENIVFNKEALENVWKGLGI